MRSIFKVIMYNKKWKTSEVIVKFQKQGWQNQKTEDKPGSFLVSGIQYPAAGIASIVE